LQRSQCASWNDTIRAAVIPCRKQRRDRKRYSTVPELPYYSGPLTRARPPHEPQPFVGKVCAVLLRLLFVWYLFRVAGLGFFLASWTSVFPVCLEGLCRESTWFGSGVRTAIGLSTSARCLYGMKILFRDQGISWWAHVVSSCMLWKGNVSRAK
jgi:hypothetical protein